MSRDQEPPFIVKWTYLIRTSDGVFLYPISRKRNRIQPRRSFNEGGCISSQQKRRRVYIGMDEVFRGKKS